MGFGNHKLEKFAHRKTINCEQIVHPSVMKVNREKKHSKD